MIKIKSSNKTGIKTAQMLISFTKKKKKEIMKSGVFDADRVHLPPSAAHSWMKSG